MLAKKKGMLAKKKAC